MNRIGSHQRFLRFLLLGPLEVHGSHGQVHLSAAMQRTLLAVLLLNNGRPLSLDRLVEELWPEDPPKTARKTLHGYAWRLRNRLAKASPAVQGLETVENGYRIAVAPQQVDAVRFERAVHAGIHEFRQDHPAAALSILGEALSMWRGPVLENVLTTPSVAAHRARMDELRLTALEYRLSSELSLGDDTAVIARLRSLVIEYPVRERLRELLMRALDLGGRQAEALVVYRDAVRVLDRELGIRPGPGLQRLYRNIRERSHDLGRR